MIKPVVRKSFLFVLIFAAGVTTASLHAEDWPQWRGVNRDGNWSDAGVVQEFPDSGLKVTLSLIHI